MAALKTNPSVFSKLGKPSRGLPRPIEQRWYVAQLRPRTEKQFAHLLQAAGVSYFLPMQARKSATNGVIYDLIFPGFCFFLGLPTDVYRAWETRKMWGVLKTDNQRELKQDLRRVARVVRAGFQLEKHDLVQPGKRVRVIHGHVLEGLEAKVDSRDGGRVLLDIAMIGCASFQIDVKFLEVLP